MTAELADPQPGPAIKREMPLVPEDSVASRALVIVIAIMTFLACLTAGAALLVSDASQGWRDAVGRNVTIQIRPRAGLDLEQAVAKAAEAAVKAPGVASAKPMTLADSQRMLEPWLGKGIDLAQLPIPRLVVVEMKEGSGSDLRPLREALAAAAPSASVDDQSVWLNRLSIMASVIEIFAAGIFALVIVAMATAVGFATRGAMAGNREIMEVLHFVGAADIYIAAQFQSHFIRVGSRGAIIGGGAAAAFFATGSLLSALWTRSTGGEEIAALFGAFALGLFGYFAIVAIGIAIALLTGYLSRFIVFHHLQGLS